MISFLFDDKGGETVEWAFVVALVMLAGLPFYSNTLQGILTSLFDEMINKISGITG